ncbi:MAG: hypothetical protein A3G34_08855 [Candidatus Lindowbacteria bacterium RIFCSPLOWO2_12_FULL_62_27]|nr:MAG: hypothetical protein A3I06_08710 [Candidatus Lindowbacteria bacterium RIFCSPLOWO2_02_FULL_62_12]OGH60807.1 MAG: hypothetical protein A3G34_08855 [Candidatus Lindowbacteria bacterium RIFCSPLOWO2_12_FULL_62_27]
MATKISMPKLSDTMKEGRLIRWHKNEGDEVKPGDVLAEVETDKANMDLEAFDPGTLLKRLVQENEKVQVGAVMCVIGDKGENIDALLKETPAAEKKLAPARVVPEPAAVRPQAPVPPPPPAAVGAGGVRVSPLAAKMAAERGIPLEAVRGSGPGGRIVKSDIEEILKAGVDARLPSRGRAGQPAMVIENRLAETLQPLDGMRKVIAERMSQAKQTIPHFYLQDTIRMDRVVGLRAALNAKVGDSDGGFSYNDFVLMAVCRALMLNPGLNATFDGIGIHTHAAVDLAFAVAFEGGLLTPVIKNCERLTLPDIHGTAAEMAERARRMKLKPDEYMGGSFTVSNLGMFGLDNFQPIINPPQVAILAVAAIRQEPCVDDEGHLYVGRRMGVTLACDHRALDGAAGASFLRDLKQILAAPETWAR